MPIHNAEIADMFDQLDDLLKQGADLTKLPDIGNELSKKIQTIIETGTLPLLEKVRSRTPAALSQMMKIAVVPKNWTMC